jgi:hypothetical protein
MKERNIILIIAGAFMVFFAVCFYATKPITVEYSTVLDGDTVHADVPQGTAGVGTADQGTGGSGGDTSSDSSSSGTGGTGTGDGESGTGSGTGDTGTGDGSGSGE